MRRVAHRQGGSTGCRGTAAHTSQLAHLLATDHHSGVITVGDMLEHRLCPEQFRVHAIRYHQRIMLASLGDRAVVEYHNLVGEHRIRNTMRNHQHRFAVRQIADGSENTVLAFHIYTVGCLIEHIDRAVTQQGAGNREALALAA